MIAEKLGCEIFELFQSSGGAKFDKKTASNMIRILANAYKIDLMFLDDAQNIAEIGEIVADINKIKSKKDLESIRFLIKKIIG